MQNLYSVRDKCIFCDTELTETYFPEDYKNYVAHYQVKLDLPLDQMVQIPFNILVCPECKTVQTKYLGDLSEIYKTNHADSTGTVMMNLHQLNSDLIIKYRSEISHIIEIGSSRGVLADILLSRTTDLKYHIIEPAFFGDRSNKIIIDDFYENVDDAQIDANTVVISHVFEHFYRPREILEKIARNNRIQNFFLVFPDLEYYINHGVLHLLNTEHIYYVDNDFLVKMFQLYGFNLVEKIDYQGHSVLFYFKRDLLSTFGEVDLSGFVERKLTFANMERKLTFANTNYSLDTFYWNIFANVDRCNQFLLENQDCKKYIWPASIHSLYLLIFGLDEKLLDGMADNSTQKIGRKMYGTNLEIFSFNKILEDNSEQSFLLINGGVFNKEIEIKLKQSKVKYLIIG